MMPSQTPRFDAALEARFREIHAGMHVCPETEESWELSQITLDAHRELRVSPSSLVPWARSRRMRASLSGIDFFTRERDGEKSLITAFDPDSPVKLLPSNEWYENRSNDAFMAYARPIQTDRAFFDQWMEFSRAIPRPALIQDPKSEHSAWTNHCTGSKNDYYGYNSYGTRDGLYCEYGIDNTDVCDVTGCDRLAWSYDTLLSYDGSRLFSCERCSQSTDLFFCLNCTNCQDCFGCTNLRRKRYYFLNEPLSAEEYRSRLSKIDLSDHRIFAIWKERVKRDTWDHAPRKAVLNLHCEQAVGDELIHCRNVIGVSLNACERTYHSFGCVHVRDSCSLMSVVESERCVYSQNIEQGYENRMCSICTACTDIEYSELLQNCHHCFGCIGLLNKSFHIFNAPYSEEDYWRIVDEIKMEMLKRGEYGEFFPYSSFFPAYNTSNSDVFFPLSESEAKRLGARWFDFQTYQKQMQAHISTSIIDLPFRLDDFQEEMLSHFFRCEKSGRLYRIVKPELEWHQKFCVALPRLHPTIRRKERATELYPVRFEQTSCSSCHKEIATRIPLSRGYTLFCELCFEKLLFET